MCSVAVRKLLISDPDPDLTCQFVSYTDPPSQVITDPDQTFQVVWDPDPTSIFFVKFSQDFRL